ncbi:MBL fold metallo-hydrolase [Wenzhouxiangella sp. XN79A]|uniref:MBL fold metallo-hydrolase n=1 Tax=Wenzhouxiangella sp. XN79A TaxID=2724193 RepID=UPI00144A7A72|nr:MBL fold metallo-hydrolase [Wenzhouxiangella sp. XN79A]
MSAAVFTHAHDDKMGGVGVLRSLGIATYAHAQSNQLAPTRGLVPAEFDLQFDAGGSAVPTAALPPELEIFYPGPGHTTDNLVVYVLESRVLFGGCLVRPRRSFSLGNTADAVIENWAQAIRNVNERFVEPTIVVPSHGAPGGPELLAHTIDVATSAEADNAD